MSEHFKSTEFTCKCGCGKSDPNLTLLDMLEKLRVKLGNNPIEIISGVRCSAHSVAVGGGSDDMHVKGGAADIRCKKPDGTFYTSETIAEKAEECGFRGIGLISDTNCHVDIRGLGVIPFKYDFWYGDERTGNNHIPSFKGMGERVVHNSDVSSTSITVTLRINGEEYSGIIDKI
ncbi:MAG: D-Ala-D-Ala carboxypeptidase family metallohydrolase [Bacilli bacterium]|nr:D-Ala-D-Ala carboxypeptidase family metallohydrolase [Bacilli bacterium]